MITSYQTATKRERKPAWAWGRLQERVDTPLRQLNLIKAHVRRAIADGKAWWNDRSDESYRVWEAHRAYFEQLEADAQRIEAMIRGRRRFLSRARCATLPARRLQRARTRRSRVVRSVRVAAKAAKATADPDPEPSSRASRSSTGGAL